MGEVIYFEGDGEKERLRRTWSREHFFDGSDLLPKKKLFENNSSSTNKERYERERKKQKRQANIHVRRRACPNRLATHLRRHHQLQHAAFLRWAQCSESSARTMPTVVLRCRLFYLLN